MLPDVSKRRTLKLYDQKMYDSDKIKEMLKIERHDGCTTPNAMSIVREFNAYLEDSRYLVVQCSVIFMFLCGLYKKELPVHGCELIEAYFDDVDKRVIGVRMANVMRIIKSLAKQRYLAKQVKVVIKKNRINGDWENLLRKFIKDLKNRMIYLRTGAIVENLRYTPLGTYAQCIEKDIYEDIAGFVRNDGGLFADDDETAKKYMLHVIDVLRGLDADTIKRLVDTSVAEFSRLMKHCDDIKRKKIQEDAAAFEKQKEEAKEVVLALCSYAEKSFVNKRTASLQRLRKRYAVAYVVAAVRTKPYKAGYVQKYEEGKWRPAKVENARIFTTEEDAKNAAEEFCRQGDGCLAEVAEIQLYRYGICES